MENQSQWKAGFALTCYFAIVGGIFLGSIIVGLSLAIMEVDLLNLPFPIALLSIPINESIILLVTILFARYKHTSLEKLGLRKISPKILAVILIVATCLFLLATGIAFSEEIIFGQDPTSDILEKSLAPRDFFQMSTLVALSLVLVGPIEELAFRGFIQKGFENSFGKMTSLLITSLLFGLLHGLNSLRSIIPVFVVSLVLGYIWQRTSGNTTVSALIHGIYNSLAIAIAFFTGI